MTGMTRSLTLLVSVCFAGAASGSSPSIAGTGLFLKELRQIFTATEVDKGHWLIVGGLLGENPKQGVSSAVEELVQNADGSFSIALLEQPLLEPRWGHRATLLKNGQLLVCGGAKTGSCELFDKVAKAFHPAAKSEYVRSAAAQILLPDGKVLLTGGYNNGDLKLGKTLASAEVYHPQTKELIAAAALSHARAAHQMFLDGNVVYVIGGLSPESAVIEQFDPVTQKITNANISLPYALKDFQSFQRGHKIYLFGGTKPDGNSSDRVLLVDLKRRVVTELPGHLSDPREDISICPSKDGKRLILFGGETKGHGRSGAHSGAIEMVSLNPFKVQAIEKTLFRDDSQVIELPDGDCLVVGGTDKAGEIEREVLRIHW